MTTKPDPDAPQWDYDPAFIADHLEDLVDDVSQRTDHELAEAGLTYALPLRGAVVLKHGGGWFDLVVPNGTRYRVRVEPI